ncbi:MAG TPA: Mg-protoporphyrin IX monomethyl ester oxidative cyclase, partial [Desulfoprunum sp.]|nr:Mg-protoporphyrin IX monomethyl ester oxidative cyclase [Desulfoprunum sp.]
CRLLCLHLAGREDEGLVRDLLRYDWLRCGHRFLPPCLGLEDGREQPEATRDRLYRTMPMAVAGVYDLGDRNHFFRKAFCLHLSAAAARTLGLGGADDGADLCFTARREESLFRFNEVMLL